MTSHAIRAAAAASLAFISTASALAGLSVVMQTEDPVPDQPGIVITELGMPAIAGGQQGGILFTARDSSGRSLVIKAGTLSAGGGYSFSVIDGGTIHLPGAQGGGCVFDGICFFGTEGRRIASCRRMAEGIVGLYVIDPSVSPPSVTRLLDNRTPIPGLQGFSLAGILEADLDGDTDELACIVDGFQAGVPKKVCLFMHGLGDAAGPAVEVLMQTGDPSPRNPECTVSEIAHVRLSDGRTDWKCQDACLDGTGGGTLCGKTRHFRGASDPEVQVIASTGDPIPEIEDTIADFDTGMIVGDDDYAILRSAGGCTVMARIPRAGGGRDHHITCSCTHLIRGESDAERTNFAILFQGNKPSDDCDDASEELLSIDTTGHIDVGLSIGQPLAGSTVAGFRFQPEGTKGRRVRANAALANGRSAIVAGSAGSSTPCDADADQNGVIGLGDIAIMVLNWGRSVFPGDTESGDANLDGVVSLGDIARVIAGWGGAQCQP